MGHFGVPVGVYGQQVSIIKGVNIGERVWTKAQRSCVNAGTVSAAQGGRFLAEPLYRETLQLREKVLDKEHPNTLTSMNNLAALFDSQGKYDLAEPLYRETLQLREKVLGKEHPDTLTSINNLAGLLKS